MRFLLSMALIVGATALFCHGYFLDENARETLGSSKLASNDALNRVQREWPFAIATTEARGEQLSRWIAEKRTSESSPTLGAAVVRVQDAFRDKLPFIDPWGVAAIALGGLVLAILLPGTRFRGLAMMSFLLGTAAIAPVFMEPGIQVGLVQSFDPYRHVIGWFPHITLGLLVLAGLTLGFRVRAKNDD